MSDLLRISTSNDRGPLSFNVDEGRRLLFFICVSTVCLVMTSVVIAIVLRTPTTPHLRIAAILQDLLMFVVPAIATAVIVTRYPARLLMIDSRPTAFGIFAHGACHNCHDSVYECHSGLERINPAP